MTTLDKETSELRDKFAMVALQALITNESCYKATGTCAEQRGIHVGEMAAIAAYDYADAMLAERSKQS